MEFCVSSGVEHPFPYVVCVKIKLQFLTAQPSLRLILWTLVFACSRRWSSHALDLSDLVIEVFHSSTKKTSTGRSVARQRPKETRTSKRRNTSTEMISNYEMWITLSQAQNLLILALCFTFLKITRSSPRPQSHARLVFDKNPFGPQYPNHMRLYQKLIRRQVGGGPFHS